MPNPTLSDAIKEAYASAPSDVVILHTLELRHATFAEPIRVVRNFPDTATWLALGGSEVQDVLDALDPEDRAMIGLVARIEDGAPLNAGEMVAFVAMAFDMELPPVDKIPVPEIQLAMDNVGREITDALNDAAVSPEKIEVTYRPYLSTDIDGPHMDPPITLTLSDVEADPLRVQGRCRMLDFGSKAFPSILYTAKRFPGLAR